MKRIIKNSEREIKIRHLKRLCKDGVYPLKGANSLYIGIHKGKLYLYNKQDNLGFPRNLEAKGSELYTYIYVIR